MRASWQALANISEARHVTRIGTARVCSVFTSYMLQRYSDRKSSKSVLGTTSEPRVVLSASDNPCIEMKQWLIERRMLGVVRLYRRYQSSDYHFPATLSSFPPIVTADLTSLLHNNLACLRCESLQRCLFASLINTRSASNLVFPNNHFPKSSLRSLIT